MAMIPDFSLPDANRRLVLARRPDGHPTARDMALDWAERPSIAPGQVLVRNIYLSADPVQRGWAAVLPIGDVIRGLAVGVVIESLNRRFPEGSLVFGMFGWQDYCVADAATILSCVASPVLPASAYAGVLGMPGVTAWLALTSIAPPSSGQRVLVSTAAGAVGSLVGQLVARAGGTAIGLTGSGDKVARCVGRFGYAAAADYKAEDVDDFLHAQSGEGFHTFFDNTGGGTLDTAIRHMARYGRIIQCGTAATASWSPPPCGLRNEREVLLRALTWTGFVIFDHHPQFGDAVAQLSRIAVEGELAWDEDIEIGFERACHALDEVFAGRNTGKKLVFIG